MLKNCTISESYRSALWRALSFSVIIGVLSALVLDWGQTAILTAVGLMVFWGSILVVIWRRPQNPTPLDLLYFRWGCLPLILGFQVAIHCAWYLRGLE
jgi:hypothetical protein